VRAHALGADRDPAELAADSRRRCVSLLSLPEGEGVGLDVLELEEELPAPRQQGAVDAAVDETA
jgi:hypothetical protein